MVVVGQALHMPNGKPGDHPLTDVLVHHLPVFNDEVDARIVIPPAFIAAERQSRVHLRSSIMRARE